MSNLLQWLKLETLSKVALDLIESQVPLHIHGDIHGDNYKYQQWKSAYEAVFMEIKRRNGIFAASELVGSPTFNVYLEWYLENLAKPPTRIECKDLYKFLNLKVIGKIAIDLVRGHSELDEFTDEYKDLIFEAFTELAKDGGGLHAVFYVASDPDASYVFVEWLKARYLADDLKDLMELDQLNNKPSNK